MDFKALTSPAAVKAAVAECDAMGRPQFLETYGFEEATEYFLDLQSSRYDSKAIAAVAYGFQFGVPSPGPGECRGGVGRGNAGWALDRLGFRVVGISHVGWWLEEVEPAVDAYLEMLVRANAGERFTKSSYLSALHASNPRRSYKAFEYKLQNISAVLDELGLPWLQGYAPKSEYQGLLRFVIEDRLGRRPKADNGQPVIAPTPVRPWKVDWAKRDAANRELGKHGELFVLEHERQRLALLGRADLASQVRWLANESDAHGYDIESFDQHGRRVCIEVKTTSLGRSTPFFVSAHEVEMSKTIREAYRLYRVFDFFNSPRIDIYEGPVDSYCTLSVSAFRASPIAVPA